VFGLKLESKGFVNMWKIPGPGVTWFSVGIEGLSNSVNIHFCTIGFQLFDVTIIRK
jgi:hypothetical protein